MVGIAAVTLVMVAPAAPVPVQPPVKAPPADRFKAEEFTRIVFVTGQAVAGRYARPVETKDLIAGAIRGLYDECGLPIPDNVRQAIAKAKDGDDLADTLTDVRILLAGQPALRGPRALYAAINGFRHATDPGCGLSSPRSNTFASIDMDFGIGVELGGVTATGWMLYQVEYKTALGQYPTSGWLDPRPKPEDVAAPAGLPWRITRVIAESPAQKAGLRPGDVITHLNGTEVGGENANRLFAEFAFPRQMFDAQTGLPKPIDRTFTIRRGAGKPFPVEVSGTGYTPASVFGVIRDDVDRWDCMLDRKYKIGYLRLGAIETALDVKVGELLADLDRKGCRALILDLRWCPGGYVDPGLRIAGLFLPPGVPLAQMKYRVNEPGLDRDSRNNYPDAGRYTRYPLVALVGNETTGGGELIASALRDNDRCVLLGQRTAGRASIQNIVDGGFGGLNFRVTVGESFRPNGKPRQRKPDSGPFDDWGLKPDEGLEVPVTRDKMAEMRRWAELHSLRPAGSNEALEFDDPNDDPHRVKALDYLRKKLDEEEKAKGKRQKEK
jgi:C-terminal processing protease CtpA/Prc